MQTANQPGKIQVGDEAPDFELQDEHGQKYRLSDYRGKQAVVLIFYPADQTPGCTKQLCTVRDDTRLYAEAGAVAFGINQGSSDSHLKFVQKHSLTIPLLVDSGLKVAENYKAVFKLGPLKIISRTVVVVGRDGRIVYYRRGMPGTAEILDAAKA